MSEYNKAYCGCGCELDSETGLCFDCDERCPECGNFTNDGICDECDEKCPDCGAWIVDNECECPMDEPKPLFPSMPSGLEQLTTKSNIIELEDLEEIAQKAELWDTLMSCERIRVIGQSRIGTSDYQHMLVDFWTAKFPDDWDNNDNQAAKTALVLFLQTMIDNEDKTNS